MDTIPHQICSEPPSVSTRYSRPPPADYPLPFVPVPIPPSAALHPPNRPPPAEYHPCNSIPGFHLHLFPDSHYNWKKSRYGDEILWVTLELSLLCRPLQLSLRKIELLAT